MLPVYFFSFSFVIPFSPLRVYFVVMLGIECFIANKTAHEQGYYNERDSKT